MLSYGPAVFPGTPVTTSFAGSYPGTQAVPGGSEYSGDTITPADNLYPGATTFSGQGLAPILWALTCYDDASDPTPSWNDVSADVRSFSIFRGRESELADSSAGTATVTLDNRHRTYDPVANWWIRPLNRIWLREQFSGETQDMFKGYVESWGQEWPDGDWSNAVAIANAADEFKVLALDGLPVTDPPRDTYEDLVMYDLPDGYWRCNDQTSAAQKVIAAVGGRDLHADLTFGSFGTTSASPIVGDPSGSVSVVNGAVLVSDILAIGEPGDVSGMAEFAISFWFQTSSLPAANRALVLGPVDSGGVNVFYTIAINSSGQLIGSVRNGAGTTFTITGAALTLNSWYHVCLTVESGSLRLYYNGVQTASTAFTPPFGTLGTSSILQFGDKAATTQTFSFDEIWFKRVGLPASRVLAHYTAGSARGFPTSQKPGERIGAVLDAAGSQAPRSLELGTRSMSPASMHGQPPLDECKDALRAQAVSAMFFASKGGTLTFYASRAAGTGTDIFGDAGGAEIPYLDATVDFSDAFLINQWNASRRPGWGPAILQTATDWGSVFTYFKRSQTLTDLPLLLDTDVATIVTELLAATKDPRLRITRIAFTTLDTNVTPVLFRYDLGDTIRVKRTPPGGGSRIDQASLIQKIDIAGDNSGNPWTVAWGISPATWSTS